VVAIFTRMLLKNQQPVINGNGEQTRDFVFVQDVVSANLLALEQKESNIFNVGTSKETTINELYRILLKKTGSSLIEKHGPGKEGEQFRSVIAYNKAQKIMGWAPRYDIEKGLEETVAYFRKNEVD